MGAESQRVVGSLRNFVIAEVFSSPKISRWPTGESIKGKSFSFTSARRPASSLASPRVTILPEGQLVSEWPRRARDRSRMRGDRLLPAALHLWDKV